VGAVKGGVKGTLDEILRQEEVLAGRGYRTHTEPLHSVDTDAVGDRKHLIGLELRIQIAKEGDADNQNQQTFKGGPLSHLL